MDLVGQTIFRNKHHVTILNIKGAYYQCKEVETGRLFPAIKEVYDRIFLCDKTPLKKKGFKGKNIHGTQTLNIEED